MHTKRLPALKCLDKWKERKLIATPNDLNYPQEPNVKSFSFHVRKLQGRKTWKKITSTLQFIYIFLSVAVPIFIFLITGEVNGNENASQVS